MNYVLGFPFPLSSLLTFRGSGGVGGAGGVQAVEK